jgi:predicted lipid carrier protein YhbT
MTALSRLFSQLPAYPPSLAFAGLLDVVLGNIVKAESMAPLIGKFVRINVLDMGLMLNFRVGRKGFSPAGSNASPDLSISADLQDFVLLVCRREDPDTLFFSRRLLVEGDTELGLAAKNTLDAMEFPEISFPSPARVFSALLKPFR